MKYLAWMLLPFALSLAGCATNASNCAGWQPIPLKPGSAVFLAGSDETASKALVEHDRYGKDQGCWR